MMNTCVYSAENLVVILLRQGGRGRFFIQLHGGARSVKRIRYDQKQRVFHVTNEIDGSKQVLTAHQLTDQRHTNMGTAMRVGAFFAQSTSTSIQKG